MYTHYYDKLSHDHRQQMQADAAQQRLAKRLPRQPGLGRHAVGKLGTALVALGSRLERVEQPAGPAFRGFSPARR
jgi:hypothetical protein